MTIIYLVETNLAGKKTSNHAFSREHDARDYAKTIMTVATELMGRSPFSECSSFNDRPTAVSMPGEDSVTIDCPAVWMAGDDSVIIRVIKFNQFH